ncbi:MAG: radical SAM protein [Anaerocolumna sp.]
MNTVPSLKTYKGNNKVILLNTDTCRFIRLPESLYQKKMQEGEAFYEEINTNFKMFDDTVSLKGNGMKSVYFALTKKCNLNCPFCSMNSNPEVDDRWDMDFNKITDIVIPKLRKLDLKKIIVTGGEPMLRKDVLSVLKAFSEAFGREKLILQSNGLLLKETIIPELSGYIGSIEISIENLFSNPALMKRMEKVFFAIKKAGICLAFSFVVDRESYLYLKEAIELCNLYQAVFEIRFVAPLGRALTEEKIFSESEILQMYREAISYIMDNEYYTNNLAGIFMPKLQAAAGCGGYGKLLSIQPEGKLYMCSNIRETVCDLGNILTDSVDEILTKWNEKLKEKQIKDMFLVGEKEICSQCSVKYFCTGPCAAESMQDSPDFKRICGLNRIFLQFMMFYYEGKRSLKENLYCLMDYLNTCNGKSERKY